MIERKVSAPGDEGRGDARALRCRRRRRREVRKGEARSKADAQEESRRSARASGEAGEVIDIYGPEYDVLLAKLKVVPVPDRPPAREEKPVLASAERADKKGDEGAASENQKSSDEAPFSPTDSSQWRRKTRCRFMNTFFLFEGKYHSE